MGGVDVYKNQTAELIEGGIAGSVNLRTRLPFDSDKTVNVVTVAGNYSDLSKSSTPEISGIHTSRYDTDVGEFGVMANFAYSDVDATSQSSRMARVNRFRDVYAPDSLYFIPQGVSFSDNEFSRQRTGAALALQWQDDEGRFLASFQYNRSQYKNTQEGRSLGSSTAGLGGGDSLFLEVKEGGTGQQTIVRPAAGTDPFEFSKDGLFAHGTMTQDHGWWGANNNDSKLVAANANGQAMVETCADLGWAGCGPNAKLTPTIGANFETGADVSDSKSVTEDFGFNFKWNVTDKVHVNFDVQQINSDLDEYRLNAGFRTWANVEVDLRDELNKLTLSTPTNINLLDAGHGIFANPNSYAPVSVMDFLGDNHGEEFATKADVVFDIDSGFVERIKTGVRYADRDQQVNQAFSWQPMSTTWNQNAPWFNLDSPASTGLYETSPGVKQPYTFNGYKRCLGD
jgi:iron complex outermembrane receptor protein